MTRRMAMAVVALAGLFLAIYLSLHAYGQIGELTCTIGACEKVQSSKWSRFLGLPVAVWGAGYYATVLVLSVAGIQERFADSRTLARVLLGLTAWGVLFSTWLTGLEAFVINAWCQWCVVSAILAAILFALALWDWKSGPPPLSPEPDPEGAVA